MLSKKLLVNDMKEEKQEIIFDFNNMEAMFNNLG